jgi:hypothetical protein
MQAKEGTGGCTIMSWAIGIAGGAVFGAAAMLAMGLGLEQSAWLGIIVAAILGIWMSLTCSKPAAGPQRVGSAPAAGMTPKRRLGRQGQGSTEGGTGPGGGRSRWKKA